MTGAVGRAIQHSQESLIESVQRVRRPAEEPVRPTALRIPWVQGTHFLPEIHEIDFVRMGQK